MREHKKSKKKVNQKLLFAIELICAILLAIGCGVIGMSDLFWKSDKVYPAATQVSGYMTKVLYLANQLKEGHFPSWFPYWYNGSAIVQYDAPLSYYCMVCIYWVTNNIMLSYKIFCASVMSIGGLGVWAFCYKKIGKVCGLTGIILYCFQPVLLDTLYREGAISQGLVFAITPWLLLLILSCAKEPSRKNYIGTTILTMLLILSNAINAFMICFTAVLLILVFLILKKTNIKNLIIIGSGMMLAGLLSAFWSFVGITGLENPGMPNLLQEAVSNNTATLQWFLTDSKSGFFYFAIAGSYSFYMLWNISKMKFLVRPIVIALFVGVCIHMNPYQRTNSVGTSDAFDSMKSITKNHEDIFDKGRYLWYNNPASTETLFSYQNNISICQGLNMEETPHYSTLYNVSIAQPLSMNNYMLKKMAYWNVRYLLLSSDYSSVGIQAVNQLGFEKKECSREGENLYVSKKPSSYYLLDPRDALVISSGIQGFSIDFPNVVQGKSANLLDYTSAELSKYKLIYIIEPSITTQSQKNKFENMVTKLVNSGVVVMIEPVESRTFDLFEVHVESVKTVGSPTFTTTKKCPFHINNTVIQNNSNLNTIKNLYGLDTVYADFKSEGGAISNSILGEKKVGKGKVIFAGAHLSQYLESVYARNMGVGAVDDTVKKNSCFIQSVYTSIFSYYGVNEEYLPQTFETVTKQNWNYDGGSFTYQSDAAKEMTVSVTYTPRWTATVDGKEISVGQRENLIILKLPAGKHTVKLHYTITIYGKLGYLISAIGLFLSLLVMLLWNWIMKHMEHRRAMLRDYFQLENEKKNAKCLGDPFDEAAATAISLPEPEISELENTLEEDQVNKDIGRKDAPENVDLSEVKQKTINVNGIRVDIIEVSEEEEKY